MNGHVLENLPIAVDCFLQKHLSHVKLHFLTHIHSDHTFGLSSSWKRPIYCTYMTAKLLRHKFKIPSVFIKVLREKETHSIICGNMLISVSVIPANHCAGSCMFFFGANNMRILYTGDFRLNGQIEKCLLTVLPGPPVNLLYLDNTYCEPACEHPETEKAIDMIIKICVKNPTSRIVIGISWVGHEDMLTKLCTALNEYVFVEKDIMDRLKEMEVDDVFMCGKSNRLNAVSNYYLTCQSIKTWNAEMPTIGIKPTAMYGNEVKAMPGSDGLIYSVPYSNHCNYAEICKFVKIVSPLNIKPIVLGQCHTGMANSFRADMSQFASFLHHNHSEFVTHTVKFTCEVDSNVSEAPGIVVRDSKMKQKHKRVTNPIKKRLQLKRGVVFENSLDTINQPSNLTYCKTVSTKAFKKEPCSLKTKSVTAIEHEILLNIDKIFN